MGGLLMMASVIFPASADPDEGRAPAALEALQVLEAPARDGPGDGLGGLADLRWTAQRTEALRVGVGGGYAHRARVIRKKWSAIARELDRLWNFAPLLISGRLLPPVVVAVEDAAALGDDALRETGAVYRVASPSRLVSRAPTWRDYLRLPAPDDRAADPVLLPRTDDERTLWAGRVAEGWRTGERQAEMEAKVAVARLRRDYLGILTARQMVARGLLTPPWLAVSRRGVVADGDGEMRVDDAVWRVTRPESFESDPGRWRVLVEDAR